MESLLKGKQMSDCAYLGKDVWLEPSTSSAFLMILLGLVLFFNVVILFTTFLLSNKIKVETKCSKLLSLLNYVKLATGFIGGVSAALLIQNVFIDVKATSKTPTFLLALSVLVLASSLITSVLFFIANGAIEGCAGTETEHYSVPKYLWYILLAYVIASGFFAFYMYQKKKAGTMFRDNALYDWRNTDENAYTVNQLAAEQYSSCGLSMTNPDEPVQVLKMYISKIDAEAKSKLSWWSSLITSAPKLPQTKYPNIVKMREILSRTAERR